MSWDPAPPQGFSNDQGLAIIRRQQITRYAPSQGPAAFQFFDQMAYEDDDIMGYQVGWFNQEWEQRIQLTINANQVPTSQVNFPMLINSTFADLIGEVEAELRFTAGNNKFLDYEIQKFDNSTGELIAWIKVPFLCDNDIIRIYFDNPGALDAQDSAKVWDVNYKGVWHMDDLDGPGIAKDSTQYGNDMTRFGTSTITGKIGNGRDFGGVVTDYFILNPFSGFPSTEIICEYWMKSSAANNNDGMISYSTGSDPFDNTFLTFNQLSLLIRINNDFENTGIVINNNIFHHVVVRWQLSPNGLMQVYIDGVQLHSSTGQGAPDEVPPPIAMTDNGSLVFGQDQDDQGNAFQAAQAYTGILDEIRISYKFRSADYIVTSFNNQSSPSGFYTIGATQNKPSGLITKMGYDK